MNKVVLIIIYNHQYNKNIDILENIYRSRFSNIYHLIPFYNGEKQNVIPVYECSYYFQGYISQGFKSYFKEEYTHYFFVADDLLLNPIINENNYAEHLKLNANACFIPGFITLHENRDWWPRLGDAFRWNINFSGVEAKNQLPDSETALIKFKKFDLAIKPLSFNQIWKKPTSIKSLGKRVSRNSIYVYRYFKNKIKKKSYPLSYPMVGSYSDIFVVSSDAIKEFCHFCGVFAATKLFVEIALPTSLALSAKEIVTEKDLKLHGKALWTKEELKELDKYEWSLKKFLTEFPSNYLYVHPVKLSKWITKL